MSSTVSIATVTTTDDDSNNIKTDKYSDNQIRDIMHGSKLYILEDAKTKEEEDIEEEGISCIARARKIL
jgi:hypothetical protein